MKRMSPRALAVTFALIALGIALDQVTKIWAAARLPMRPMEVIPKALSFVYVENHNAAFGLGSGLPDSAKVYILLTLTIGLTLALVVAMVRATDLPSQIGFAATVSGAIGNIVDRVQLGYVRDFIYWHGGFQWPNFNIADMLVVTGVGVLVVFGGREQRKQEKAEKAAQEKAEKAAQEKAKAEGAADKKA